MIEKICAFTNSDIEMSPSLSGFAGGLGVLSSSSVSGNCIAKGSVSSGIVVVSCQARHTAAWRSENIFTGVGIVLDDPTVEIEIEFVSLSSSAGCAWSVF